VAYYKARGVHFGMVDNWTQFFSDGDTDGTGQLTLEELDEAVRLRLRANVSRYELRVLWRRVDMNGSGLATLKEFTRSMYSLSLFSWPNLSEAELDRCTATLSEAANRLHHAGGNWFKIFRSIDVANQKHISFLDFTKYVRSTLPGLQISPQDLSDSDLRGLWKAIDVDVTMHVTLHRFMVFFRKSDSKKALQAPCEDTGASGDLARELAAAPVLDADKLGAVGAQLSMALRAWLTRKGKGGHFTRLNISSPRLWGQLFDALNTDGSRNLTFSEFESAVRRMLRVPDKDVPAGELKAFWRAIDSSGSGEVKRGKFCKAVYHLQLLVWPALDDDALAWVAKMLNDAADHYYQCCGNWYKVFAQVDKDQSGEMEFDEFAIFVRNPFPNLGIPVTKLSDDHVRGIWRVVDSDSSGKVSLREFTAFMRHHSRDFTMQRSMQTPERQPDEADEEAVQAPERTQEELRKVARALDQIHVAFWKAQGIFITNMTDPNRWARFFKVFDSSGNGRLTFPELEESLHLAARGVGMSAPSCFERDDLLALWHHVDRNGSGEVTDKEWWLPMYRLELETWPEPDEAVLTGATLAMSEAAERWHQAGRNWYKVFKMVDLDSNGAIAYDELEKLVRRPPPCLGIPEDRLSERDLMMLWKAMDSDCSGVITVQEFMVFMRRRAREAAGGGGGPSRSPRLAYTRGAMEASLQKASSRAAYDGLGGLDDRQLLLLGERLCGQSQDSLAKAFATWGFPWTGAVSEWDLLTIVRRLLYLGPEQLNDDAVATLWGSMDRQGLGSVPAEALLALGPELRKALAFPREAG